MRTIVLVAFAAFVPAALAAGPVRFVDLDRPGAFAALAQENPAHHRRALEMIRIAENSPCKLVPRYEVAFEPQDFSCAPTLLMTSFPPKRRVEFTLDDTRYFMVVSVVVDARAIKLK